MGRAGTKVQFVIPACDNADQVDRTIESIYAQDFDQSDIFITIMDFGSDVEEYKRMLRHASGYVGVYRNNRTKNKNLMLSEIAKVLKYVAPSGCECFYSVLYPGDVLYPDFLGECVSQYFETGENIKQLICETDLFDDNGRVLKQESLFQENCIIDGKTKICEYVDRGFRHQVQCLSITPFCSGTFRAYGEMNEQRWWNKLGRQNIDKMAYYMKKPLVCQRQIKYYDELEEILFRWESLILQEAAYEVAYNRKIHDDYISKGSKNLARYALWRSYLLADSNHDMSEDCFMISSVIDDSIEKEEAYQRTKRLLNNASYEDLDYLQKYYSKYGMN